MRCSSILVFVLVFSVSVFCVWASPTVTGEEPLLGNERELIVDSDETRKRLLTTELAVSRKLIDMSRSELPKKSELSSRHANPQILVPTALTMIERIRSTQQILQQLGSSITPAPWLRREELSLQVIEKAIKVEQMQNQIRKAESHHASKPSLLSAYRKLHWEVALLLPLQLEFAKELGASSSQVSQISSQWLHVGPRAKSLFDDIVKCYENQAYEDVEGLWAEVGPVVEEIQCIIVAASELCSRQPHGQQDAIAIRTHVDTISSLSEQLLQELDAEIAKLLPTGSSEDRLWLLQISKLAFVREMLQSLQVEWKYGVGRVQSSNYSQVLDECFHAELALCQTSGERIARCRQHISKLREAVQIAEEEFLAGDYPGFDLDQLRIRLLDAEIFLLREELGKNAD